MDQGYKHFSHFHNLVMHQMPEGVVVSCSGCHSSATRTVYVCWQCNFFLHDRCFRAARSLKHPSHPPHPLTLIPYPTYPSSSFYCNSCRIMGTGFSYSCADCEFDLHVHCAYSNSMATSFQEAHQFQELVHHSHSIPFIHTQNLPYTPPQSTAHFQAYQSIPQNGLKDEAIMHFSHSHNLFVVNLKGDEPNKVVCSGCKYTLVGNGYSCIEPNCNFHLHESCFHLKKEIQHKSHPEHPLNLLQIAPYNNKNGGFTCNACFSDGTGFTYHCSICKFDLHIHCACSLPETVKRADHEHALKLFYSCPVDAEEINTVSCYVCGGGIPKDCWAYYCESCKFDTHLGCVESERCERDGVINVQVQLQRLKLEMEMSQQLAQMIAGMGASINNLAG
ncbi:hypothetical protein SSX86_028224 [Deinandra increscens subsp. villosa]|uniref:DC1 domain-containing protein n=1 Tax=Deinandra increscens subsp. villosa TaxID=3103831 RepID=A0AAP0GK86_9ASTR